MQTVILLVAFILFFSNVTSLNCIKATTGCDPSCAASNQLTVKIEPKTFADQSCNLLTSPQNGCCLLGQAGSPRLNFVYQNWCCVTPSPATVIQNIQNVSYITQPSIGKRVISYDDSDGSFTEGQGVY